MTGKITDLSKMTDDELRAFFAAFAAKDARNETSFDNNLPLLPSPPKAKGEVVAEIVSNRKS